MQHPTAEPSNVSRRTLANRLASDLDSVESVNRIIDKNRVDGLVRFEIDTSNVHSDVLAVLADHDARLNAVCLESNHTPKEATAHVG